MEEQVNIENKIQDKNNKITKSNIKKQEYVKYNNEEKKILEQDGEKYLIEIEIMNLKGYLEKRKQWFHKSALEII